MILATTWSQVAGSLRLADVGTVLIIFGVTAGALLWWAGQHDDPDAGALPRHRVPASSGRREARHFHVLDRPYDWSTDPDA